MADAADANPEVEKQEAETPELGNPELEVKVVEYTPVAGEISQGRISFQTEEDRERSNNMESRGCLLTAILIAVALGALLVVILVPLGFADLEYYEMGFVQKKSTGKVDRSKVYMGGRHFVGVDEKFKKFKANAHTERFSRISIFNKDKIEVTMTFTLQYVLIPDELRYLHDTYDLNYAPVLRQSVSSAIKDAATKFTVDQFRLHRHNVSTTLFRAARINLGGTCCSKNCKKFKCYPGCKPYSTCSTKDKGMFAFLKNFLLEAVSVTNDQEKLYLDQVIAHEKQETEAFKQQEKIVRKKTEQVKIRIENQALETSQNATAQSGLIAAQAAASAKSVVEDSRNSGLQIIYSAVNVTKEQHKKSLDYIRTLRNHKNVYMYVGFKTLIGREGA